MNAELDIKFPENLPITQKIEEIGSLLEKNPVIVVAGETGSGKTTQLPKLCLRMFKGDPSKKIGHTQPRRIAARTVAARIAEELKTPLGTTVGYKIRFQDRTHVHTQIKVMTDGILLAETQTDPLLKQYDTLIIDEAHERSLNIDFLLGLLKKILIKRCDLKIIITSATLDPEKFSRYFDNAPIIEVSGRGYPVEVLYRPLVGEGEEEKIIHQVEGITQAVSELSLLGSGDILVFLSGEREIRETAEALSNHHPTHTEILPLYSRLNAREQHRVFEDHIGRRIILATNVAETSVTVPNIQFVIDTGLARIRRYNYRSQVERLRIESISKASCDQRKGRCGRVMAGICVRLYSEADFLMRAEYTEPEILRSHLSSVILQMLALGLGDIEAFPFLDPPDNAHIRDGIRLLEQLDAISETRQLTSFGRNLSQFPLDPKLGAMILASVPETALREVLIIVSALSIGDPRERPLEWQKAADAQHARFKVPNSDFLVYLKLWDYVHGTRQHLSKNKFKLLCQKEFLSFVRIQEWIDIHQQLHKLVLEQGYRENEIPAQSEQIHRALLKGLLGNIGFLTEKNYYIGVKSTKFQLFPGSLLYGKPPKWVMAFEIVETERVYARTVAKILPEWIEKVAQKFLKIHYSDPHWEKKVGHVMASAKATYYGLVIYEGRKLVFGRIDPKLAREIFIRNALVLGEYDTPAPFFDYNRQLIESIETLEHKSRRADILVNEETLYEFYDQKIPEDIYNRELFEKWIKTIDVDLLKFAPKDIMSSDTDAITVENYPNTLNVNGMQLPLNYHFVPGQVDDGVTVMVPFAALPQLSEGPFIWLVPGLLPEKIAMLIKNLPKNYRRHFVPVPEYTKAILENLVFGQGDLIEKISKQLTRMSGVPIPKEAWDPNNLPEHLKMNFKIVDEAGNTINMGRELSKLKAQVSQDNLSIPIRDLDKKQTMASETWEGDSIPESIELNQAGINVKAFPALIDRIDFVSLENKTTLDAALFEHHKGVRRLLYFALKKDFKIWMKQIPNLNTLALQFSSLGDKQELFEDLWIAAIDNAFLKAISLPRTKTAFLECLSKGKPKLGVYLQEIAKIVSLILPLYSKILKLKGNEDTQEQLQYLIYKGFISNTPYEWLLRIPVYLQALELRLTKLRNDPEKDKALTRQVKPYWDRCLKILQSKKPYFLDPEFENFRWMIEEFRVSLFAQSLKTKMSVSSKRIDEQWGRVLTLNKF